VSIILRPLSSRAKFINFLWVLVIVIFGLMPRMVVVVVTAGRVIVVLLIFRVAVRKAVAVFM